MLSKRVKILCGGQSRGGTLSAGESRQQLPAAAQTSSRDIVWKREAFGSAITSRGRFGDDTRVESVTRGPQMDRAGVANTVAELFGVGNGNEIGDTGRGGGPQLVCHHSADRGKVIDFLEGHAGGLVVVSGQDPVQTGAVVTACVVHVDAADHVEQACLPGQTGHVFANPKLGQRCGYRRKAAPDFCRSRRLGVPAFQLAHAPFLQQDNDRPGRCRRAFCRCGGRRAVEVVRVRESGRTHREIGAKKTPPRNTRS